MPYAFVFTGNSTDELSKDIEDRSQLRMTDLPSSFQILLAPLTWQK